MSQALKTYDIIAYRCAFGPAVYSRLRELSASQRVAAQKVYGNAKQFMTFYKSNSPSGAWFEPHLRDYPQLIGYKAVARAYARSAIFVPSMFNWSQIIELGEVEIKGDMLPDGTFLPSTKAWAAFGGELINEALRD